MNLDIKYIDFGVLKNSEYGNELYELAEQAKYYVVSDPESCTVKSRKFIECFVDIIYDKYQINKENLDLFEKITCKAFALALKKISNKSFPNTAYTNIKSKFITNQ